MNPQEYCAKKVAPPGSNLYYSVRFIAPAQQQALLALQALFSEVSEIITECHDNHVARIKYEWWQDEISQLFAGHPHHPISHALIDPIARYQLPVHHFEALIAGLMQDSMQNRYATLTDLVTYCQTTGSILQLLCAQVLGSQQESTLIFAEQLGIAARLLDILQEVRRDALQGRIYIPQTDLATHHVTEEMLLSTTTNPAVVALFAQQAERIRGYYQDAFAHLAKADHYAQRSQMMLAQLALATLREIELDGYQLFKHRVELTPLRKLWIVWKISWQPQYWR